MADNKFNTGRILENIKKLKATLPTILANHAQNFFTKSWKNQGWEGKAWPTPQRKIEGTFAYKFSSPAARSRAILVQSGKLRRAAGMSIRTKTFEKINLVVGLPYAKRHNEGLDGMPQRKFMGDTPTLRNEQKKKISQQVDKVWKA